MNLIVKQTNAFKKTVKKLNKQEKKDLDSTIKSLLKNPEVGTLKSGDLDFMRVHKFKMNQQATLLAYEYEDQVLTLTLIYLGSHENFYRDVKKLIH